MFTQLTSFWIRSDDEKGLACVYIPCLTRVILGALSFLLSLRFPLLVKLLQTFDTLDGIAQRSWWVVMEATVILWL